MPFKTDQNHTNKTPFYKSIGAIVSAVVVLFIAVFLFSNYIKYANLGVASENAIETQYKANQNKLGQLSLKVKESLGVARVNNEELERIIRSSLEGRYGNDGEGAKQAMLWVQENYPGQYDPTLMVNVRQTILAGRTDFETAQNLLLDKVRVYKNQTEFFWSGFWLKMAGYPKIDFKKYDPVISKHAQKAFETKIDEGFEIK